MDNSVKYIQNSLYSYTNEEIFWQLKLRNYLPKIVVYEYDDYDFPMNQIFPTKSVVEKAIKRMYD